MTIRLYTPANWVTVQESPSVHSKVLLQGAWITGDEIQDQAKSLNIFHLIDAAIKLPVTRVTLDV